MLLLLWALWLAGSCVAELTCTVGCDRRGSNHSAVSTACLQRYLDTCKIVVLPAGVYHTGSLVISSGTTLRLEAGATLLGSFNPADYPLVDPLPSYGTPRDCCCNDWLRYNCSDRPGLPPTYFMRHRALLTTVPGAKDIVIEGEDPSSSVIDGNGWPWWARFESGGLIAGRPHLVEPMFVTSFRIEGIWLKDSPFWTLHPYACTNVVVRRLSITADPVRGHNTDGIDPDSCSNVLVEDCYIRVGDDAVAIKSGIDFAGRVFNTPSKDMVFRRCTFASRHVSFGSEESGGIENVTIQDSVLGDEDDPSPGLRPGVHLKAERGRGGYIKDITFERLIFVGKISQPIVINMSYSDARPATNASATPRFERITLRDITVKHASEHPVSGWAGGFAGLPESPITDLRLENVQVLQGPSKESHGEAWLCSDVSGFSRAVAPPLPDNCLGMASQQAEASKPLVVV